MNVVEQISSHPSPSLIAGERLDRKEFHRRYRSHARRNPRELIGGVVHMPSQVGRDHGRVGAQAIVWLSRYEEFTAGVEVLDNVSVFLGDSGEPQPDALLRVLPALGGQSRDEGDFVAGAGIDRRDCPRLASQGISKDTRRLIETLDRGLATPEHAEFQVRSRDAFRRDILRKFLIMNNP